MTALIAGLGVAVVLLLVITLRLAWRGRAAEADLGGQARAPAGTAQKGNVAVLTRYEMWMRRVEREQLDVRGENWGDLSSTSQYAAWRRLAEARGASDDVQHYVTRSLLSEVIYAAGGVERELRQLCKALADVQKFADQATPRHSPASPEQPIPGPYAAAPSLREASYSFVNLLGWARATVERTDRPYRPGSSERTGLLPALAHGQLRDSVEAALQHLRAALRDSRFLASYALHTGAVPGGGTPGAEIMPDGHILTRVPDLRADPVLAWEVFEFTEDRDMLTYATELMAAIEIFVTRVLDAFAANQPATADPLRGRRETAENIGGD